MSPTITTIPARTGTSVSLLEGQTIKLINTHGTQVIDFWAFTYTPLSTSSSSSIPLSFHRQPKQPPNPTPTPYPIVSGVQYLSASRTRSILSHLTPFIGDILYTNKSTPLLKLIEDTTESGIHDTVFGCCDRFRYRDLAQRGYEGVNEERDGEYEHGSCAENMHGALRNAPLPGQAGKGEGEMKRWGEVISDEWTPDPLNVFMHVPVTSYPAEATAEATRGQARTKKGQNGGIMSSEPPQCKPGEYIILEAMTDCLCVMSACPNDVIKGVNTGICRGVEFEVAG